MTQHSLTWGGLGEAVTLPSGNVATLKPLDVLSILSEEGDVPNFLMGMLDGQSTQQTIGVQELVKSMPLLNRIARACFVSPRIVDEEHAQKGEGITVHQVSLNDKLGVMMWCMGGEKAIQSLKTFLDQPKQGVSPLPQG